MTAALLLMPVVLPWMWLCAMLTPDEAASAFRPVVLVSRAEQAMVTVVVAVMSTPATRLWAVRPITVTPELFVMPRPVPEEVPPDQETSTSSIVTLLTLFSNRTALPGALAMLMW